MNKYFPGYCPVGLSERYQVGAAGQPALASTIDLRAAMVLIQNLGADVYLTLDGSTPSATNGFLLSDKDMAYMSSQEFVKAKWFCATSSYLIIQPESP